MEIGSFLLMLGLSYALGVFWYDLLPGKLPERVWRVAAYPFLGMFVTEALLPRLLPNDPQFGGFHVIAVVLGSMVGVVLDWVITLTRRPALVAQLEARAA